MSAWNGDGSAQQWLAAPASQPCVGWEAAGASSAGGQQDALCDGNRGGQLNKLGVRGEGLFPKWNFLGSVVSVAGLTYTVSYSRLLFTFRNGMCKIHSNFPSPGTFSFSFLMIQCSLFLGAASLVVGGRSLLLRIAPVFRNTIDSAFWSISVCWSFMFCPTH